MFGDWFFKCSKALSFACNAIAIASLVVLVALLLIESIVRKVIGMSLITVNEVGGIGMYLFVALSMSWIYRMGAHLRADFLITKLPPPARRTIELALHALTCAFTLFVAYLWWQMFMSTLESGRYYRITRIVEWPYHFAAVVGWVMLSLSAIEGFVMEWRGTRRENA